MIRVLVTSTRLPRDLPESLDIVHVPLLVIEHIPLPTLPDSFEAVFYSGHAVDSVVSQLDTTRVSRAFVVGKRTQAKAKPHFADLVAPKNQTFLGVMELLADTPCALPRISFELEGTPRSAADTEYDVKSVAVYRSCPVSDDVDVSGAFEWVVFGSPRAVDRFLALRELDGAKVAAIGPTTAAHLRSRGIEASRIAPEPDTAMLLRMIG